MVSGVTTDMYICWGDKTHQAVSQAAIWIIVFDNVIPKASLLFRVLSLVSLSDRLVSPAFDILQQAKNLSELCLVSSG